MGNTANEAAPATRSTNRLVLASRSPRRQALLTDLGVAFQVASAQVDESQRPGEMPSRLVQRLARAKALAVAPHYPGHPILAADTIVVLDGVVLGKPTDATEATAMLRSLRSRAHLVLSAVYALASAGETRAAELSASLVWMRDYTDREIEAYIASGDPMDKAGAYAIQNRDFAPVARIEGCFSGVMGFPLGHVTWVLQAVGVLPPVSAVAACRPHAGRCCLELT
jgi:septum formation protein